MGDGVVKAGDLLNLPEVARVRYPRNFIKTTVCELRFPTLLELETKPPRAFQAKIRKSYPFYESQIMEPIGGPEGMANELRYVFRSKDQHWTVSVKSSALAIETTKYVDFENFHSRFVDILASAKEMVDADFFTRIGLRYINEIPIEDGKLEGWIRPELTVPLTGGALGSAEIYTSLIQGHMDRGQYSFRQGYNKKRNDGAKAGGSVYRLDIDYSAENIEYQEVESLITYFNETNFRFFSWCLGEKAKAALGKGQPK